MTILAPAEPLAGGQHRDHRPAVTLAASVLGFFIVTLGAVVVNVALPSVRADLGGGMTGLQWVVDGYTLLFAALLLSAGALSDRAGARRTSGAKVGLFVAASAACGLAPFVVVAAALAAHHRLNHHTTSHGRTQCPPPHRTTSHRAPKRCSATSHPGSCTSPTTSCSQRRGSARNCRPGTAA